MADKKGRVREKVIMQIFYYTGIRVSELEFVTVEALKRGYIDIKSKGKHRQVPINTKLKKILKDYIKSEGITEGYIIRTRNGNLVSRSDIHKNLKWIGGQARVKKDKVYPHSFRHLFAKQWLKMNNNNILVLADILGHNSFNTTRMYTTLGLNEIRDTINF